MLGIEGRRERPVFVAISLMESLSRKYIRRIFAYMIMVITFSLLLLKKQAAYSDYLINFERAYTQLTIQF